MITVLYLNSSRLSDGTVVGCFTPGSFVLLQQDFPVDYLIG